MALARFSDAGKFSLNKYNYSHSNSGVSDRRGILGKICKLFHLKKCKAADSKIQGRTQGAKSKTNSVLFRAFPAFCWTFSFWFICFSPFPPLPILFGRKALKVDSFARRKSCVFRAHFCLVQWKMVRNQRRRYKFKRKKTQTVDESQATGSGNS